MDFEFPKQGRPPTRRREEDRIQRTVFQHVSARGVQGIVAFAVPNGGARPPNEASILVGLGVLAGVPDLFLFCAGRAFALEIKTPTGRLSRQQESVQARLRTAGVNVTTAYGLDDALSRLEAWGLLRGKSAPSHYPPVG